MKMENEDRQKINLLVDNERYPLIVERDKEPLYREAADSINYKLNRYREMYPGLEPHRHWAMVALELAYEYQDQRYRDDTRPYREKLDEIESLLDGAGETEPEDGQI